MILPLAYAYCNVSVMPIRKDPFHSAEQTSQLIFGEKAEIIEINNRDWARIHCSWDGYEGWCKQSQLAIIQKKEYRKGAKYMAGALNNRLAIPSGDMWLPLGSDLISLKGGKLKPTNEPAKYKGKKIKYKDTGFDCESIKAAAMRYLHAPYVWGGRSVAGIDCSGLVQMAFKLCNKPFPRDSEQQSAEGELVDFLQHAQCGDLAFFDNKEGKIVHVGILLDNQTIIHATDAVGRVVVDRIDQAGIISTALKMRTHNLRFVKRIINNY